MSIRQVEQSEDRLLFYRCLHTWYIWRYMLSHICQNMGLQWGHYLQRGIIHSSDPPKWCCASWHHINSHLLMNRYHPKCFNTQVFITSIRSLPVEGRQQCGPPHAGWCWWWRCWRSAGCCWSWSPHPCAAPACGYSRASHWNIDNTLHSRYCIYGNIEVATKLVK